MGNYFFARGDFIAALHAHGNALTLIDAKMHTNAMPFLAACDAAHATGQPQKAHNYLVQATTCLDIKQPSTTTLYYHYAKYQLDGDLGTLRTARHHLHQVATKIVAPQMRADLLTNVVLHQRIEQAWREAVTVRQVWLRGGRIGRNRHPLPYLLTLLLSLTVWTLFHKRGVKLS